MAKYRMVQMSFWEKPVVNEEMTPEELYFFLYLLTNPQTTQCGIYKISKKKMAFDMGYSLDSVESLMNRFIYRYKMIRYNAKTREIAIKNWRKYNLNRSGKPVMDCIKSELERVEDVSLILYVADQIKREYMLALYLSFTDVQEVAEESLHDTFFDSFTIRGQKEEEKEKEKQQEQENTLTPSLELNIMSANSKQDGVKEIMEYWDQNGFGVSNIFAKQKLLSWLKFSIFDHPKDMIVEAMKIACSHGKRQLSYVEGILKNWEKDFVRNVEDIVRHNERKKRKEEPYPYDNFELDITTGEGW